MEDLFHNFSDQYINRPWRPMPGRVTLKDNLINCEVGYPIGLHEHKLHRDLQAHIQHSHPKHQLQLSSNIRTHRPQQQLKKPKNINNIILINSTKGGVGKSTLTTQLAHSLQRAGARVGILDADIYGPNQPQLLQQQQYHAIKKDHYRPNMINGVACMSMGYLVDTDTALIWRGPMASAYILQMLNKTRWPDLDYLLCDLPPGTGDIHLTLAQKIPVAGSVIITTAQQLSVDDCNKGLQMLLKLNIPVLGIIENMSTYTCPHCQCPSTLWDKSKFNNWAKTKQLSLLGQIPFIPQLQQQNSTATNNPNFPSEIQQQLDQTAIDMSARLAQQRLAPRGNFPKIVIES